MTEESNLNTRDLWFLTDQFIISGYLVSLSAHRTAFTIYKTGLFQLRLQLKGY